MSLKKLPRSRARFFFIIGVFAAALAGVLLLLVPISDNKHEKTSRTSWDWLKERAGSTNFGFFKSAKMEQGPYRDRNEWLEEVIARNPGLEPVWRDVPAEKNGFLQWLEFSDKHRKGEIGTERLDLPEEIAAMLSDPEKWDSAVMGLFLEENQELLEEISRIGLLPERSAAGIDISRWYFTSARLAKQSSEILLADARLAAESGDKERALLRVRAAVGLASHLNQIEAPTVLWATVSILIRLNVEQAVIERLLPSMKFSSEEISQWRDAVRNPHSDGSSLGAFFRGEAWVSLNAYLLPQLNGENLDLEPTEDGYLPDHVISESDALIDTFAQGLLSFAEQFESNAPEDFFENVYGKGVIFEGSKLSEEARELLEVFTAGSSAWAKGSLRSMILSARNDAALALLQGEELPLEPITGLPYAYDPVARTLQVPDDPRIAMIEVGDPLKLP